MQLVGEIRPVRVSIISFEAFLMSFNWLRHSIGAANTLKDDLQLSVRLRWLPENVPLFSLFVLKLQNKTKSKSLFSVLLALPTGVIQID